ncbi:MAG: hydantoinase/oxoprolinase family protein [Candidatus Tectomicrobia bacterium]|nr:hydantoinase/oxoprolinase family protein [Candidatus Tectomicrobia bacterium]
MKRIGIDTGGTFTDFIMVDGDRVRVHKVLSTPENPGYAVIQGLRDLIAEHEEKEIIHGSTVATNAILERKGARTALITTLNFEDVLEIGRQMRPKLYDFFVEKPKPLVPASRRFGVPERTSKEGEVIYPVDLESVRNILKRIQEEGVESIAICFLFSYANPENEIAVMSLARELDLPLSASHRIIPEYREYERCSTTVMNAYVLPLMGRYISYLEERIGPSQLKIMQSNGGCISAVKAKEESVRTILSGPAGGVVGAFQVASLAGYPNVIAFDMGGTSTDVSLSPGRIRTTSESMVEGFPVKVPMIDIHTVGAGGGSLAFIDSGGALRVGPESAGADPGPICYGKGEQLTVTDANLFLGRLDADHFLGGAMKLDLGRVIPKMQELASRLGLTPQRAAEGIIEVANATMERAIRVISVERGYDPREFVLVSFGGAGPVHACELAEGLSIPRVVVPKNPGILSAFGMIHTDLVKDFSLTVLLRGKELTHEKLIGAFRSLNDRGMTEMKSEGIEEGKIILERTLDMRYVGQSYEITVPFSHEFRESFHALHQQIYGYANAEKPVEVVNLRLKAIGQTEKMPIVKGKPGGSDPSKALIGEKEIVFSSTAYKSGMYDRDRLDVGNEVRGPALITEFSATTVIPPGFIAKVDEFYNLVIMGVM